MAARWLVPIRAARQCSLRLVCFPYAGGPLRAYPWLNDCIGENVEVWAASLPGRGARFAEPPVSSMPAIAEALVAELALLTEQPYALFGHSMGALLSFELARAARRRQLPQPVALLVSGARSPDRFVTPRQPPRFALPRAEFLAYVASLGGMPAELLAHPELVDLVLPALRADFAACESYRYSAEPPLPLPLTILGGVEDPEVDELALRAWQEHVCGPTALRLFAGDHFFINSGQRGVIDFVSAALLACAERAQAAALLKSA